MTPRFLPISISFSIATCSSFCRFLLEATETHSHQILMKFEHVAFNVEDPAAFAEWYVRHLNVTVRKALE